MYYKKQWTSIFSFKKNLGCHYIICKNQLDLSNGSGLTPNIIPFSSRISVFTSAICPCNAGWMLSFISSILYIKTATSEPLEISILSTCCFLPDGFDTLNSCVCYIVAILAISPNFSWKFIPNTLSWLILIFSYILYHTIFIFGRQLKSLTLDPLNSNSNQLYDLKWVTSFCFSFFIGKQCY